MPGHPRAKVLTGLGEVAARLGLGDAGGDLERAAAAVRHWLEADGDQCLLVFDNAADMALLRPFVPVAGDAQVVITSNLKTAADLGQAVPVDVFTEEEAQARTLSVDHYVARVEGNPYPHGVAAAVLLSLDSADASVGDVRAVGGAE